LPNNHLAYFFLLRIKIRSNPSGADGLGETEGLVLGLALGDLLGLTLGEADGLALGDVLGLALGDADTLVVS